MQPTSGGQIVIALHIDADTSVQHIFSYVVDLRQKCSAIACVCVKDFIIFLLCLQGEDNIFAQLFWRDPPRILLKQRSKHRQ